MKPEWIIVFLFNSVPVFFFLSKSVTQWLHFYLGCVYLTSFACDVADGKVDDNIDNIDGDADADESDNSLFS